jgi:hypothetical protein
MGICPKKFGPYFWGTLHLACLYSDDVGAVKALVDSYLGTLPCPMCRVHFAEVLEQLPFPTDGTRSDIFTWSVKAHNIVNAHTDKPQMTVDDALDFWTSGCGEPLFDLKFWVMLVVLIGLVLFLFRKGK